MDLLVSWSFRHVVDYDKIRQFNVANLENGHRPVQIYSPREGAHEEDAPPDRCVGSQDARQAGTGNGREIRRREACLLPEQGQEAGRTTFGAGNVTVSLVG